MFKLQLERFLRLNEAVGNKLKIDTTSNETKKGFPPHKVGQSSHQPCHDSHDIDVTD